MDAHGRPGFSGLHEPVASASPGLSGDHREGATGVSWKTHPSVPCLLSESPGGAAAGSLGLAVIP